MRVTWNIALQAKNKFEGLGDIIVRIMGQLPVPITAEETVTRLRHRQADITSPSMFEAEPEVVRWSGIWHFPTRFLGCSLHRTYSRGGQGCTELSSSSINLEAAGRMVRFSTRIAEFSSQPAATAEEIRIGSKTQPAREPATPPAPSCHIWLAGWPAWQPPLSPHITGEQLVPKNRSLRRPSAA